MTHAPTALLVIDVQDGFDDPAFGPTSNPSAETNIERLIRAWTDERRGPVVVVRHDSQVPGSPLSPSHPGNQLKAFIDPDAADLLVTKTVNSAFLGTPDLHRWLTERTIEDVVICGIQTNMCVETTTRMAGNLGYRASVPLDATRTFDLQVDVPGTGTVHLTADELTTASAVNLAGGRFATVTTTDGVLGAS